MATVDWSALSDDILGDVFEGPESGPDFGDRYEICEVLGRGGQGTVYQAWDRVIERPVAIKCLRDPGIDQRPMLEEARLLGRLAHPAIPQLLDRGTSPDGGLFVVMQFIAGERLDRYLAARPFDLGERVRLFRAVAGAVDHAHARGILHRDLKPENVMVTADGEPYLVDWGLAAHGGPRAICGTPYFAAPEQLEGQVADRRADVYALGILFYHILTGRVPYARPVADFGEFRRLRATLEQIPLREREPRVPRALAVVYATATAAQPAARYQRVAELLADLDNYESGRPLARQVGPGFTRRVAVLIAALVLVGIGYGLGVLTWGGATATPDAPVLPERESGRDQIVRLEPTPPRALPVLATDIAPPADVEWSLALPGDPLAWWRQPPVRLDQWRWAHDYGRGPLGGRTRLGPAPPLPPPMAEAALPRDIGHLLPELEAVDVDEVP